MILPPFVTLKTSLSAAALFLLAPLATAAPASTDQITQQRGHLNYCVDPGWMPFEQINKAGEHEGIVADYLQLIGQQLSQPLKLVPTHSWVETMSLARAGKCDLIPAINSSPERQQFLNFTSPYLESAVVIVARNDADYMDGFAALEGKQLGIVSGYIYDEMLTRDYPQVKRIYASSVREAFRKVASGKLDATVASLLTATRLIQEQGLSNLKIAGGTGFSHQLRVGVRKDNPALARQIETIVSQLPASATNNILQRWYTVKLQQAPNYTLLYQLGALAILAIGLLYYRSHRISQTRNQLGQLNNRLSDRNARLERLTQRDPLTGARNRLKLSSDLQHQLNQCAHSGIPVSLILLNLTQLRQINLQHGHTIGDLVISEACQLVRENLPASAQLGRWDGGKFLILLPEQQEERACSLLDGLLRRLEQYPFSDNTELKVKGVAVTHQRHESFSQLMDRLEGALKAQPTPPSETEENPAS